MSALLNAKHERFAREIARGANASQAYIAAGFRACRQNASRLMTRDDIKRRVGEIQTQRETDNKNNRDPETGQFLLGHKSNGGRPRGSRNLLGEKFIADLHDEWEVSGAQALKRVVEMDPVAFVKVVAQILPHKIDTTIEVHSELLKEVGDFHKAWVLARQFIGADDDKLDDRLIELQPVEEVTDG